jgi:hypothetical protein
MVMNSRDPALLFPKEKNTHHVCVEVLPGGESCKHHIDKEYCTVKEGTDDLSITCSGVKDARGADMLKALRFIKNRNAMNELRKKHESMCGHGHLSDKRAEGSSPFPIKPTQVCF